MENAFWKQLFENLLEEVPTANKIEENIFNPEIISEEILKHHENMRI